MPPKEEPKDNDGKEGKSALEEELNLIGGKELVLARMELDTSQNHLKEKIKENKTLMKACEELKSHLETQKADAKDIYYYLHTGGIQGASHSIRPQNMLDMRIIRLDAQHNGVHHDEESKDDMKPHPFNT